ncbi:MAG: hypothetical protein ChlgKO_00180 [Chlamydiales bacterium]
MSLPIAFQIDSSGGMLKIINSPEFDPNSDLAMQGLMRVIKKNNETVFRAMLEKGVGKNRFGENGNHTMHVLARKGNALATAFVEIGGMPIDLENDQGETLLSLAAASDNVELVKDLIALGAKSKAVAYAAAKTEEIRALLQTPAPVSKKKHRFFRFNK